MRPEKGKMPSPFRMTNHPAPHPNPFPMGQHRPNGVNRFILPTPSAGQILHPQYINMGAAESFAVSFQVHAHIYSGTIRYRQYVKGYFKYNDVIQPQPLFGGNMDPHNFMEDGNENGVYGGDVNKRGLSVYTNEVAPGNIRYRFFKAWDTPGDNLGCPSGTKVEINLTFRGILCERDAVGNIYDERIWHVRGTLIRP